MGPVSIKRHPKRIEMKVTMGRPAAETLFAHFLLWRLPATGPGRDKSPAFASDLVYSILTDRLCWREAALWQVGIPYREVGYEIQVVLSLTLRCPSKQKS